MIQSTRIAVGRGAPKQVGCSIVILRQSHALGVQSSQPVDCRREVLAGSAFEPARSFRRIARNAFPGKVQLAHEKLRLAVSEIGSLTTDYRCAVEIGVGSQTQQMNQR